MVPIETFSIELLEDDRFLKRAEELWALVLFECNVVEQLPEHIWEDFAALTQCVTGAELRNLTISAMHTSVSYLREHAYKPLLEHPLKATQGDLQSNIATLKTIPDDRLDRTSLKIKHCMVSLGLSELFVERCFKLLRESPCSTGLVEKAHAGGSFVKNFHRRVASWTLSCRAMLTQARPLFRDLIGDFRESQLRNRLEVAQRKRIRFTARNQFCREIIGGLSSLHNPFNRDTSRAQICSTAVAKHNRLFDALGRDEQNQLEIAAAAERRRLEEANRSRIGDLKRELTTYLRLREENRIVGINRVSEWAFTESELCRLARRFLHPASSSLQLRADTERALAPPCAPCRQAQKVLETMAREVALHPLQQPWWASIAAWNRERFRYTAVAVRSESNTVAPAKIYLFMAMLQNPVTVGILEADRCTHMEALESMGHGELGWPIGRDRYTHSGRHCAAADIPCLAAPDADLIIVRVHWCGDCIITLGSPIPFDEFIAPFREQTDAVAADGSGTSSGRLAFDAAVLAALLLEFPWLSREDILEYLDLHSRLHGVESHGARQSAASTRSVPPQVSAEAIERTVVDIREALLERREAHADEELDAVHFYFNIPGNWSQTRDGDVSGDAVCTGRAHTRPFCARYGFPVTKQFRFRKFGEMNAVALAKEWVRRGNYFFSVWSQQGSCLEYVFSPGDIDGYEEATEWTDFLASLPPGDVAWERITELFEWTPDVHGQGL